MYRYRVLRNLLATGGLMLVWVLFAADLSAQPAALIEHNPVTQARRGQTVTLEARLINAASEPVYVRLYYRQPGQTEFEYLDMSPRGDSYRIVLPAELLNRNRLEYFIAALLADRRVVTHPALNPYGNPHELAITGAAPPEQPPAPPPTTRERPLAPPSGAEPVTTGQVEVLILSPDPGSTVPPEEAVIAVSFVSEEVGVDSSSIRLFVDGEDVTAASEVSAFLVSHTPPGMRSGRHLIQLAALDTQGKPVGVRWTFRVQPTARRAEAGAVPGARPTLRGRGFASLRHENVSDSTLTTNRFGVDFSGRYRKLSYGGQVLLTSLEDKFAQPRNRFSFRFGLPWLQFVFGDAYPRMNDLIMWGKRVRGVQGGLHLGFFNVDIAYGQTRRAIQFTAPSGAGPLTGTRPSVFEQNLFAVRPSFGSGRTFQFGLTLMRVRDDTASVQGGQNPQDNIVVGPDLFIALDQRRIELRASAAASFLTNDISSGALSKDSVEAKFDVELPFDPESLSDLFIINESTVPLDPTEGTSIAWQASITLRYFNNQFEFGYRRLGPEYRSLGQTFLRNDLRGWYVRDRIGLYNNRIFLNLGYENYDDNFTQSEGNPKLDLKTASVGVSVYPGPSLPALSFTFRNHDRDNGVTTFDPSVDPFDRRESNVSRDVSVLLNYNVNVMEVQHTVTLNVMSSNRDDRLSNAGMTGTSLNNLDSDLRSITVRSKYRAPIITTFSFASNQNTASGGLSDFKFRILSGQIEYLLLNERMRLYGGLRVTTADGLVDSPQPTQGIQVNVDFRQMAYRFGGQFDVAPNQALMLDVELIRFRDNGFTRDLATGVMTPNRSFNDRRLRAYYEVRL